MQYLKHLFKGSAGLLLPVLCGFLLSVSAFGSGEESYGYWPHFEGPDHDSKSSETGLLEKWPEGGPELLWTAQGLGEGYSSVSCANGFLYTTGNKGEATVITALDINGKVRWRVENGPAYDRSHPGTRSTPTISEGRVYHENADGDVVCLDAKNGRRIWSLNILDKFDGRNISWGLAESLLIDKDRVVCTPGGEEIGLAALDKEDGSTVWVCKGIGDKPGYCSPRVIEWEGTRQIVTMMAKSVVGVEADTGKLLWKVKHVTPFDENISTVVFHKGYLCFSTRSTGTRLLKLNTSGGKVSVKQVWHVKTLENQHGGIMYLDGYLYGSCRSRSKGPWVCLDFKTGERTFSGRGIGRASFCYADGKFYMLNHRRTVGLLRPDPGKFDLVSSFRLPDKGRGPSWAHPVVCGGRLYLRHGDYLYCYNVKAK